MAVVDMGASVLAKLKNKSKQTGKSFQLHLQLFCQEEFLRRLSMSKYADNLILKGGLFIYALTNFESRATIDVDFLLRNIPNHIGKIEEVIKEILKVDTGNSFVEFTASTFEIISPQRKYTGVSCQIIAKINNTRTPFSVDIGVGDIIVPKPEKRKIPVQLEQFATPEINTYSLESTIAEKFDAILQRLELTSRMKDFYDIYFLSHMYSFEGCKLQEAIQGTLNNRGTSYGKNSIKQVVRLANNADMNRKWNLFLRQLKVKDFDFTEVLLGIQNFLTPVWEAIVAEQKFNAIWDNQTNMWE